MIKTQIANPAGAVNGGGLSCNTPNGAQARAMIYSLAVTACVNGLNVEDYFYRLLISDNPVLPWNV